jgi:hypothetical protein
MILRTATPGRPTTGICMDALAIAKGEGNSRVGQNVIAMDTL